MTKFRVSSTLASWSSSCRVTLWCAHIEPSKWYRRPQQLKRSKSRRTFFWIHELHQCIGNICGCLTIVLWPGSYTSAVKMTWWPIKYVSRDRTSTRTNTKQYLIAFRPSSTTSHTMIKCPRPSKVPPVRKRTRCWRLQTVRRVLPMMLLQRLHPPFCPS